MRLAIFQELLSKKMTRKEFLLHLGLLFIMVTGISALIATISDPHLLLKSKIAKKGFGSGPYGV